MEVLFATSNLRHLPKKVLVSSPKMYNANARTISPIKKREIVHISTILSYGCV